ncbi:hypothetical protein K2173_010087 [Erythroxylum novogranatense]|uniref:Uncharacterized protein n=1 Tax=Erythroxylum novogranatense TaxID=1862640 RepID=A0AAV8TU87_9ROSI|nr:hypothetical protein K2173_010087 [Erythroxylum novogranatense]
MSSNRSITEARKALAAGACFYLDKPICLEDLKYLWQHVYRKRRRGAFQRENLMSEKKQIDNMKAGLWKYGKYTRPAIASTHELHGACNLHNKGKGKLLASHVYRKRKETEADVHPDAETCIKELENACIDPYLTTLSTPNQVEIKRKRSNDDEKENEMIGKEVGLDFEQGNTRQVIIEESDESSEKERRASADEEKEEEMLHCVEEEKIGTSSHEEETEKKWKKSRMIWTPQLHRKFTAAISALGNSRARPKSILKLMDVPNLTQRQVASHLQKYKAQVQRLRESIALDAPPAKDNRKSYGISPILDASELFEKRNLRSQNFNFGLGGDAFQFSQGSENFVTQNLPAAYSSLRDKHGQEASTRKLEDQNSSSVQFTLDDVINAVKIATNFNNSNQRADDMANLSPFSRNAHNSDKVLSGFLNRKQNLGASSILNPPSNVASADKFCIDFSDDNNQSLDFMENSNNELNSSNFLSGISMGIEEPDAVGIFKPTSSGMYECPGHFSGVGSILDYTSGMARDNITRSTNFNDRCQEMNGMTIASPATGNMNTLDNYLINSTNKNHGLDNMEFLNSASSSLQNTNDFRTEFTDGMQAPGFRAVPKPTVGNVLNADLFSINFSYSNQESDYASVLNHTSGEVQNTGNLSAYTIAENQEMCAMALSNSTTVHATNAYNARMDFSYGNQELIENAIINPPAINMIPVGQRKKVLISEDCPLNQIQAMSKATVSGSEAFYWIAVRNNDFMIEDETNE